MEKYYNQKAELAHFLVQKYDKVYKKGGLIPFSVFSFSEEEFYSQDYEFLSLDGNSFSETPQGETLGDLDLPGVYAIHCFVTDQTYFCHSNAVITEMGSDYSKLDTYVPSEAPT